MKGSGQVASAMTNHHLTKGLFVSFLILALVLSSIQVSEAAGSDGSFHLPPAKRARRAQSQVQFVTTPISLIPPAPEPASAPVATKFDIIKALNSYIYSSTFQMPYSDFGTFARNAWVIENGLYSKTSRQPLVLGLYFWDKVRCISEISTQEHLDYFIKVIKYSESIKTVGALEFIEEYSVFIASRILRSASASASASSRTLSFTSWTRLIKRLIDSKQVETYDYFLRRFANVFNENPRILQEIFRKLTKAKLVADSDIWLDFMKFTFQNLNHEKLLQAYETVKSSPPSVPHQLVTLSVFLPFCQVLLHRPADEMALNRHLEDWTFRTAISDNFKASMFWINRLVRVFHAPGTSFKSNSNCRSFVRFLLALPLQYSFSAILEYLIYKDYKWLLELILANCTDFFSFEEIQDFLINLVNFRGFFKGFSSALSIFLAYSPLTSSNILELKPKVRGRHHSPCDTVAFILKVSDSVPRDFALEPWRISFGRDPALGPLLNPFLLVAGQIILARKFEIPVSDCELSVDITEEACYRDVVWFINTHLEKYQGSHFAAIAYVFDFSDEVENDVHLGVEDGVSALQGIKADGTELPTPVDEQGR